MALRGALLLALASCRLNFDPLDRPLDAAADVALGAWSAGSSVIPSAGNDDDPALTEDELELYFNRNADIYVAKRAVVGDAWGPPTLVVELTSADQDTAPDVVRDGLTMFLGSDRPGGLGFFDMWISRRADRDTPWSLPTWVGELSSPEIDSGASMSSDQLELILSSRRLTRAQLFTSTRASSSDPWSTPVHLTEIDGGGNDTDGCITPNGLALYFSSDRLGNLDLYVARRASRSDPFGPPERIVEVSTAEDEQDPWISADERHLLYTRGLAAMQGGLFEATR